MWLLGWLVGWLVVVGRCMGYELWAMGYEL